MDVLYTRNNNNNKPSVSAVFVNTLHVNQFFSLPSATVQYSHSPKKRVSQASVFV